MLACRDVSFGYRGSSAVLRGVTCAITPGAVTVVLGPNGAGKTTLMKLMLGAIEPSAGSVMLGKRAVHEIEPQELARRLAYVPQRGGTEFSFSVRQVLEFGLAGGARAGVIEEIAAELSLAGLLTRPANELSEGQRQRVTLARALVQIESSAVAMAEKILLADEPFSAMDHRQERIARSVLVRLAERGCAVLVVMHDLKGAARFASRALLLDESGGQRSCGPIEEVMRRTELEAVFGPLE